MLGKDRLDLSLCFKSMFGNDKVTLGIVLAYEA